MFPNWRVIFVALHLLIIVTACTPAAEVVPVSTPVPGNDLVISATPLPSQTAVPVYEPVAEPTLLPTQLTALAPDPTISILTPNPDQIERWQEYETALGNKLLGKDPFVDETRCEWKILGQAEGEEYLWVVCTGTNPVGDEGFYPTTSIAVVVYLNAESSIEAVAKPRAGTYAADVRSFFPPEIQELVFDHSSYDEELLAHLEWRRTHPEPPLIILETTPVP